MTQKVFIVSVALLLCAWAPLLASTAGEIRFDSNGKPIPVQDPAITGSFSVLGVFQNLSKKIDINLTEQTLSYYYDDYLIGTIKISSGVAYLPTPTGTFYVEQKIPVKEYIGHNLDGSTYDFKNTLWNLKFSALGYYIHGAYWHNNFGHPMSHGCVNVSYKDMPQLYEFANVGTEIFIHK